MTSNIQKLLSAGLILVLLIAMGTTALRLLRSKNVERHLHVDLILTAEAVPGKVLRVGSKRGATVEYTCTSADAAVAVLAATSDLGQPTIRVNAGIGTDENGSRFSTGVHTVGDFTFVTIHKGYSHIPRTVSVPLTFVALKDNYSRAATGFLLEFKKFALPVRAISAPSGVALIQAEKHVYAQYIEDKRTLLIKTPGSKNLSYRILARSFESEENLKLATVESPFTLGVYDDQSDALEVQLETQKVTKKIVEVTYKDAEVRTIRGLRVLWFPTTEQTGMINGEMSSIQQTDPASPSITLLNRSKGEVSIDLDPSLHARAQKSDVVLVKISPSLDEMGLDSLGVDIKSLGFHEVKKARGNLKRPHLDHIPTLTLQFAIVGFDKVPGPIYTIPVHPIPTDPSAPKSKIRGDWSRGPQG